MNRWFTFIVLYLFFCQLDAQTVLDIKSNIRTQTIVFPQEKVYIHTDKAAYNSGDTIWYRIYLVDAALHVSDLALSRYVYVDLVDPMGKILNHSMIRPDEDDCYHNSIVLDGDLAESYYMIRGYTQYMLNRPDYVFQKKVFVSDPQSHIAYISVHFTQTGNRRGSAKINFKDRGGNLIEGVKYTAGVDTMYNLPVYTTDREVGFRIIPDKQQTLFVAVEYNNRVYRKYVSIPELDEVFDVGFYPEGGYILADEENVVGFKALNVKGIAEQVEITLMDGSGNLVTTVHSNVLGMGKLSYYAQAGKEYIAVCTNAQGITKEVRLPDARQDVYTLQAQWKKDNLTICARQGSLAPAAPLWLVVHVRGMVVREGAIMPNAEISFPITPFPSGVVHILLLDDSMNLLSERLLFCLNKDRAAAEITIDRRNYSKREHIQASIKVKDQEGFPLSGSYSVSVTDNNDLLPEKAFTIESVLLLSSDLRGYIESPGYYFNEDEDRSDDLDALLLTQGWRRYNLPAVVKGVIEAPAIYAQQSQEISGIIRKIFSGKPIIKDSVMLFAPQAGLWDVTQSGERGAFLFDDMEQPDSTRYIIRAISAKSRETEVVVNAPPVLYAYPFAPPPNMSGALWELSGKDYPEKANHKYSFEDGLCITELSPAVVMSNRISMERGVPAQYTSIFSSGTGIIISPKMIEEEIRSTNNVLSLLVNNISGLDYTIGEFGRPVLFFPMASTSFSLRGARWPAAIYVDDCLMDEEFDIRYIPLTDIVSIEAMKRPSSALMGMDGTMGGAVLIMTNKWGDGRIDYQTNPGIKTIMPLGYKRYVEFYAPKYETSDSLYATMPDLRTTIFWKPNNIVVHGTSTFDFYAADADTTYSIVIEGITDNGKIFRQMQQIERTDIR